jgi:peptidyl-prolyl cis-trans isomerase SurA
MKKALIKKIFLLLFLILNSNELIALEVKAVYKIENEIITNIDIKNQFKYLLILNNNLKSLDKENTFKISKDSLIREKIKKIELLRNLKTLDLEEKFTENFIKNVYLKLELKTLDDFNLYLKNIGLNLNEFEEKVKIDILWNEFIVKKYSSKIYVDVEKIKKRILSKDGLKTKNYLLSEIIYEIKNKDEVKKKYTLIQKSIDEIGFENSASIYSISETSKTGGSIGWISEKSINKNIIKNIDLLNRGDISKPIIIPGGILVLKVNDIKVTKTKINYDEEFKQNVNYERNKQFEQYSTIHFNKTKKNLGIDE